MSAAIPYGHPDSPAEVAARAEAHKIASGRDPRFIEGGYASRHRAPDCDHADRAARMPEYDYFDRVDR